MIILDFDALGIQCWHALLHTNAMPGHSIGVNRWQVPLRRSGRIRASALVKKCEVEGWGSLVVFVTASLGSS